VTVAPEGVPRFRLETATRGDVTVIALEGALDGGTVPEVQDSLDRMVPSWDIVLLDLSRMSYLSSEGLRLLLLLYRHIRLRDGQLALAGMSEDVRTVLQATGFLDTLLVADDVEEGLESLGAGKIERDGS
jgi:anti-sigma B factor antagonist